VRDLVDLVLQLWAARHLADEDPDKLEISAPRAATRGSPPLGSPARFARSRLHRRILIAAPKV